MYPLQGLDCPPNTPATMAEGTPTLQRTGRTVSRPLAQAALERAAWCRTESTFSGHAYPPASGVPQTRLPITAS